MADTNAETVSPEQAAAEIAALRGGNGSPAATDPEPTSVAAEDGEEKVVLPGDEEPTEEKVEVKEPTKLQKLVDSKYGGDWDKFTDSLYEQWNSTARIKQELDALKQTLESREAEPTPEDHPDFQWVESQITALDAERSANTTRQTQVLMEIAGLDKAIAELKGELRRADDLDKGSIESKMAQLEARMESKSDKWETLKEKATEIDSRKSQLERQKASVEKQIEAERAQQQRQEWQRQDLEARTIDEFETSVDTEAKRYSLPNEVRGHMKEVIAAEASYYLRSLDPSHPPIDIAEFVKARTEAYVNTINAVSKTKFTALTRDKISGGTVPAPKGTKAPGTQPNAASPQPGGDKPWSVDFAKARARKIMGVR